jgi:hypothetical protein
MKFLLAVLLVVSSSVFAKTLDQYDASRAYFVHWPTVLFPQNANVPVKNVCVDGELLKTISPVKYCTEMAVVEICTLRNKNSDETCRAVKAGETPAQKPNTRLVWGCVGYATNNFETTRAHDVSVCTKWEQVQEDSKRTSWKCVEWGKESKDYPLSYDVSVTQNVKDGDREVANLNYTIPQCK